jgi:hypothetical protein
MPNTPIHNASMFDDSGQSSVPNGAIRIEDNHFFSLKNVAFNSLVLVDGKSSKTSSNRNGVSCYKIITAKMIVCRFFNPLTETYGTGWKEQCCSKFGQIHSNSLGYFLEKW